MNMVAFVFQDTHLFKGSIADNLRVAKKDASEKELLEALHQAQCDDIIAKFPDGIHSILGEEGVYVSGGERQRLAIARALLKDAPIIILDEATAFADAENEAAIEKAFKNLTKSKTLIMIAHRLSTIVNADEILVIGDGEIKEAGTHQELLEQKGIYSTMWNDYNSSIKWKFKEEVRA